MIRELGTLLRRPSVLALWVVVSWVVVTGTIWFQNLNLIRFTWQVGGMSNGEFLRFLFGLYAALGTNFTPVGAILSIVIAIMFGLNISLLVHYIARARRLSGSVEWAGATSLGGLVSGFLGIGCSSCGSIIVATLLAQFGAVGLLAWLPFHGLEFNFVAVLLLGYSLYVLIQKLHAPMVCDVT